MQAPTHIIRRRCYFHAAHERSAILWAPLGGLVLYSKNGAGGSADFSEALAHRELQCTLKEGAHITRYSYVSERVGAIGSDVKFVDDLTCLRKRIDEPRARFKGSGRVSEDPFATVCQAYLRLAAQHPLAHDPPNLPGAEHEVDTR